MTANAQADLDLITEAARAAGAVALTLRAAGLTTTYKADKTPVSNADLAVDTLLRDTLARARPDYGWLSEETADDPARLERRRVFVVDPIDGTRAFVKHRPWWAVSIAVVEDGRSLAGVVFAPDRDEIYQAIAGEGAAMNGLPLACGDREAIADCAMLADAPMMRHPAWAEPWPQMRIESRNSVAYRICSVASAEFDATLALSSKAEWDLAAAGLIAREAGCAVSDHKGRDFAFNRPSPKVPSLVVAGPSLHELILRRVRHIDLPNSP
ncbi:3'(2'),5'-bisphosphate nucleotidase CysQ [Phenylobacterium montanum]|uniref:3'(2'),5'-bisphosphate nucleotidase CysQ n=1 Tax=Phenylobacterium montanum TaxID=2823693 RepID=A0A975FXU1_9CAUL|nr:3'(2'),5'-bisphosphate nucleotidase CysQ [Caulobacter sp. S6]QUD87199.1 3'(2'),5'-bisphosphate nucleotidase CysQ [Caulobacter sp. S6]